MYSPEFMRFIIGRDIDEYLVNEKEKSEKSKYMDNKIFRNSKFATIPIELKK